METKQYADNFLLKNYKCPRLIIPSFNAETLLEPFRHCWKVQNCSELIKIERAINPAIFSDTFKSSFDDKFSLTLWPNGYRKGVETGEIAVHLTNDEQEHLARVQWRIWFCNQQNNLLLTYGENNIIGASHLSAALLDHKLIINKETKEAILPGDTLFIYIEVSKNYFSSDKHFFLIY